MSAFQNICKLIQALFTLYQIDLWSGLEISPIQCEQCSENLNWTGPVFICLSCSHSIGWIWSVFVLVGQKKARLESKRMITRFHSKNRADLLNSQVTLEA